MNCDDLQNNLPLYADDVLSDAEREAIAGHLPTCPLCRLALADYRSLRGRFRALSIQELPAGLETRIKSEIREEISQSTFRTLVRPREDSFREKFLHWLMPYSVGTVAASLLMLGFLFLVMSELQSSVSVREARGRGDAPIVLANSNDSRIRSELQLPLEFGDVPIAVSPPALNPAGALIALTKSIVRGDMKDEEVVIVADVFGNGLARITEVVDPPENERAMRELEKAFETEPESAPFLPSDVKNDAGRVRVVLRIQRVDVANRN